MSGQNKVRCGQVRLYLSQARLSHFRLCKVRLIQAMKRSGQDQLMSCQIRPCQENARSCQVRSGHVSSCPGRSYQVTSDQVRAAQIMSKSVHVRSGQVKSCQDYVRSF